jgi:hypothetical protein
VARTLLTIPDLTLNCPQVVSGIFFCNEMLLNLNCDLKSITLDRKAQKRGDLLSNRGKKMREEFGYR